MQCRLIREMPHARTGDMLPVGQLIAHKDAFRLVQMGVAIPEDHECRERCGMSVDEMLAAQKAYERTNRGIHPDDFEAYDRGYMVGYRKTNDAPKVDALGNTSNVWEPGVNFAAYQALLDARVNELVDDEDDGEAQ